MWPFTSKILYDRYSKLIKLIKSIDSHFEVTENKEDSVRLHLPNYKGNQPMDFHIYLMEPFLFINFVTEIEGEKVSVVNSYPQGLDQQDIFNGAMANNLEKVHQILAEKSKKEENEGDEGLNDEQRYALYYYAELCYYNCTKKNDAAHSTIFNLFLSTLNLSKEEILQLKSYYSSAKQGDLYKALKSIDDNELIDIFISMCVVFVDDTDTYSIEKEFGDMLQAIGLSFDDVRNIMKRKGLASTNHYYDRKNTSAWDALDGKPEIIESWPLLVFARDHGKMQVGDFVNKETGEQFKSCIFTKPDRTRVFVAFSSMLGELTPKEIAAMKEELYVVQFESGNYSLCKKGNSSWENVDLDDDKEIFQKWKDRMKYPYYSNLIQDDE